MYVVYSICLYFFCRFFCRFFCSHTIKIIFPKKMFIANKDGDNIPPCRTPLLILK